MIGTVKKSVEIVLRKYPPLFRFGSKVYHKINPGFRTLTPALPQAIDRAFEQASQNGVVGDYFEFGVFRGYSFLAAFEACKKWGCDQTHLYGFDSFEGLPAVEGIDKTDNLFFEGQFACSKKNVEKNLTQRGMDWSRATLVEGYYENSLTDVLKHKLSGRQASVVLMDCDLYASTYTALTWLADLLADQTIVLFDDWLSYGDNQDLGQQKALELFLVTHPGFEAEPLWRFGKYGKTFRLRKVA